MALPPIFPDLLAETALPPHLTGVLFACKPAVQIFAGGCVGPMVARAVLVWSGQTPLPWPPHNRYWRCWFVKLPLSAGFRLCASRAGQLTFSAPPPHSEFSFFLCIKDRPPEDRAFIKDPPLGLRAGRGPDWGLNKDEKRIC